MLDRRPFLEIENIYGLLNDSIEGVYYWYYFRNDIWMHHVCRQYLDLDELPQKNARANSFFETFYNICFMFRIKKSQIGFFCDPTRYYDEGVYKDCITDDLIDQFKDCVCFENPILGVHYHPAYTKEICYTDRLFFLSKVQYKIFDTTHPGYHRHVLKEAYQKLEKPINKINEAYQVTIDLEELCQNISNLIIYHQFYYHNIKRLLIKSKVQVIVESCYYGTNNMIMNEAAEEIGIKTIELMHGIMGNDNIADKFMIEETPFKGLPDYFFVYSDYWKKVASFPQNVNVISTGNPHFDSQMKKYGRINRHNCKTILFISQHTIGSSLAKVAIKLKEILGGEYHIIYKLHPYEQSDWRSRYPELGNANIDVIDNSEKSLYYYFSISDYQVGVYSTALYEGIAYGLPTFILKVGHYEQMEPLVENGYATFFSTEEDLLTLVSGSNSQKNNIELFKPDAIKNEVDEIMRILSCQQIEKH